MNGRAVAPGSRKVAARPQSLPCENVQLEATTVKDAFIRFRMERDATLAPPRLLFPSVQDNIAAGCLPHPHANGGRYLSIPPNLFNETDEVGSRRK